MSSLFFILIKAMLYNYYITKTKQGGRFMGKKIGSSRYGNYIRINDEFMIRERSRYSSLKTRYYMLTKKKHERKWNYLSSIYSINGLKDDINYINIEDLKGTFIFAIKDQVTTITITDDDVFIGDIAKDEV